MPPIISALYKRSPHARQTLQFIAGRNCNTKTYRSGFTLIELMLAVLILAILFTLIAVELNAPRRLKEGRDASRKAAVENILSAIHLYFLDKAGVFPEGMHTNLNEVQLGIATSGCQIQSGGCQATTSACLDLREPLAAYLKTIPIDPSLQASSRTSGYTVSVDSNRTVTVTACGSESNQVISESR